MIYNNKINHNLILIVISGNSTININIIKNKIFYIYIIN